MIGSLTKCIAEFLRSTEVVKNNNIPVYTANTVEGRFTVNTSLPAILITVAPSENPTVFISGNILDSINIHIRYMDDLLNYTMSEDDGIYEDRRDWAYQLRDELWNNKQSTYFKQFMNVNGLNIMYKGMSTYTQVGVLENLSKDIDVFSFIFSCNLFSDRLSNFPTVPLEEFFITLEGAHWERPDPELGTVTASGRAFPIWNTVAGDDKLLSLSIHGRTEQDGTPSPESPVPLQSVGDEDLYLYVMQDKEGSNFQTLDIKTAMQNAGHDGILRSVNGIYDEVFYDGKQWKLIQRIKEYSVDDLHTPGNYSFKKFESVDNVQYAIYYKTPQDDLVSGVTSPFMSDYSDKPFWPGVIYKGVGYYFGNLVFSMLNGETTETEALNITKGRHYQGLLINPIEYLLDLPQISTYEGQTYFATNTMEINPRMVAQCQVSEKLDYIKEGLLGYWTGRGRSNTDENRDILPDLSGNGNDLTNYNMAYTVDSGYGDGYIQYDGVDDFSSVEKAMTNIDFTILFTISDVELLTGNSWSGLIYGSSYYLGINKGICFSSENRYIMNGNVSNANFNIANKGKDIFVVGCFNGGKENNVIGITLGSINNSPIYACKQKIYDVLIYNRELTDEEIEHNYKVSLQYNGMTL